MAQAGVHADATIYRSPEARSGVLRLYDDDVARWRVAVEGSDLSTRYGTVHVLSWGDPAGQPVLLLHAASMAAIPWAPNTEANRLLATFLEEGST